MAINAFFVVLAGLLSVGFAFRFVPWGPKNLARANYNGLSTSISSENLSARLQTHVEQHNRCFTSKTDTDISLFEQVFGNFSAPVEARRNTNPNIFKSHKGLLAYNNKQPSDPLFYNPVDLDLAPTIDRVFSVLNCTHGHLEKRVIAMVRGTGGGKTFALSHLRNELLNTNLDENRTILPVQISFDSTEIVEFLLWKQILSPIVQEPDLWAVNMLVIARMASAHFNIRLQVVNSLIRRNIDLMHDEFDRSGLSGGIIARFLAYLATKNGKSSIVLLADNVDHLDKIEACPVKPSAILRSALLDYDYNPHHLQSAVVMTASGPGPFQSDGAGAAANILLAEELDATAIVDNIFLTDVDADGTRRAIVPRLADYEVSEAPARYALTALARLFAAHPRALELIRARYHGFIKKGDDTLTLEVSSRMLGKVFEQLRKMATAFYPNFRLPDPDLLYALLYNESVPIDARVLEGIKNSTFTNSLASRHYPTTQTMPERFEVPNIRLKMSMFALYEGAMEYMIQYMRSSNWTRGGVGVRVKGMLLLENHIWEVYNSITDEIQYCIARKKTGNYNFTTLIFSWLGVLITAAQRAGYASIPVRKLLRLPSGSEPGNLSALLDAHIVWNNASEGIGCESFRGTCRHVPYSVGAVLSRLNLVLLDESKPHLIIESEEGDCWDYALAYMGAPDATGERSRRIIFFDGNFTRESERSPFKGARALVRAATTFVKKNPGAPKHSLVRAVANKEHLYVHFSTRADTRCVDEKSNGIIVERQGTRDHFGMIYNHFETLKERPDLKMYPVESSEWNDGW